MIFDLDGTLVDSLPGIAASLQYTIREALPGRTLPNLRAFIGPPIAKMLADFWPDLSAEELRGAVATFRRHYDAEGCLESQPYPDVALTLAKLRSAGLRLFVLTNKPLAPARRILAHTDLSKYFDDVRSPDSNDPPYARKSDGAQALARRHTLVPTETVIVGDGIDDLIAAREGGFGFIAATYGYGKAAAELPPDAEMVKSFFEIALLMLRRGTA